jgi:3-oxo-5alpha-steroid 4-dehydrogenase
VTATVAPVNARDIANWDVQADVVIAGYGIAGAAAAIEAARAGVEVLVLERTGGWGGAAALAGGFIYLGGGTPIQKACGFEDSVDNMCTFLCAAMGPGADEDRIADYCAGSLGHFDWLVDCGVPFKPSFWGEPGWEPPDDDGLMYTGGENAFPYNGIATPAPRGHVPRMKDKRTGEKGGGYMLMKPLVDTAAALGVQSIVDTRAQRLVVESDGRVVGIIARQYGNELAVYARRGVVLATGSFAYNESMVARYAPRIAGRPAAAIEEHDGIAIQMAQALGADLAHMDATEVAFLVDPQLIVRGVLVNGRGQRYVAEDTYPGRIGQLTLYQQDDTAFLVLDAEAHEQAMASRSSTPFLLRPPTWKLRSVCRPARCRQPSRPTTTSPRGVKIRCCTRSRSGCVQSARRWARSTFAATPGVSRSAVCTRRWPPRCCTSAATRSPACSRPAEPPRGWLPGGTPAVSRWATAASTAAAPAGRPPRPDSRLLRPARAGR